MFMNETITAMNKIEKVEHAIKYAEKKIQSAPKGILHTRIIDGVCRYYVRADGEEGKDKYLGAKDTDIIKKLQEKGYYQQLKKEAEIELKTLKRIQKLERKIKSFEQVYFDIPENKRNLVTPYVPEEIEVVKKKIEKEYRYWEKERLDRKGISRNIHLTTLDGERVRSKSELIIADRLKNAKVPYYYEGKYIFVDNELNGKRSAFEKGYEVWFPDFQVLNTRTGELLFWEHFGLMDNPDYCASAQFKIETYAKHGFVIGKNLIVTMESSQHTLNVEYVDKLIEEFLK